MLLYSFQTIFFYRTYKDLGFAIFNIKFSLLFDKFNNFVYFFFIFTWIALSSWNQKNNDGKKKKYTLKLVSLRKKTKEEKYKPIRSDMKPYFILKFHDFPSIFYVFILVKIDETEKFSSSSFVDVYEWVFVFVKDFLKIIINSFLTHSNNIEDKWEHVCLYVEYLSRIQTEYRRISMNVNVFVCLYMNVHVWDCSRMREFCLEIFIGVFECWMLYLT